jgi:uncharacterized membrane protein YqjE
VFTISLVGIIVDSIALMDDTSRWGVMVFFLVVALVAGIVVGNATTRR